MRGVWAALRRIWPFTARGSGAIVFAVGCFVGAGYLGLVELVWFGVLLGALVGGAWAAVLTGRRHAAVARRLVPPVPTAGGQIDVTVGLSGPGALPPSGGTWHDPRPEGVASGPLPARRSGRRGQVAYRARVPGRGPLRLGPLEITTTDPFGLARNRRVVGDATMAVATPAVVELVPLADLAGLSRGAVSAPEHRRGQGSDDLMARPWAPGDSMRRIHWRATARLDEVMVRQEERESAPEATIVLDRSGPRWGDAAGGPPGSDPGFETAVSTCASALERLCRDGYDVDVVDADGVPLCGRVEAGDRAARAEALLLLATVTARPDDRLLALVDVFAGEGVGPLVVVTGRVAASDAATLTAVGHRSSLPLLLATAPAPGALAAAAGWGVATLHDDVAQAWLAAGTRRRADDGAA